MRHWTIKPIITLRRLGVLSGWWIGGNFSSALIRTLIVVLYIYMYSKVKDIDGPEMVNIYVHTLSVRTRYTKYGDREGAICIFVRYLVNGFVCVSCAKDYVTCWVRWGAAFRVIVINPSCCTHNDWYVSACVCVCSLRCSLNDIYIFYLLPTVVGRQSYVVRFAERVSCRSLEFRGSSYLRVAAT